MHRFLTNHLESLLNNRRMLRSDGTKGLTVAVNSNNCEPRAARLRSYSEVVNYTLKRYVNDEAIAKVDAAIPCFTKPTGVTRLQYRKALFARVIRVGDVYDEGNLKDAFIEGVDESIRYSLCHY